MIMNIATLESNSSGLILPAYYEPGVYEVIVGRGKKVNAHPGNCRFRQLIQQQLPRYMAAFNKTDKSFVVSQVLHAIRHWSDEQLGFVKKDTGTGRWISLKDSMARVSVGQAFRDLLTGKYRSSRFSKQQKRMVEQVEANRSMCRRGSTGSSSSTYSSSSSDDNVKEDKELKAKLPSRKRLETGKSETRKGLKSATRDDQESEEAPKDQRDVVQDCLTNVYELTREEFFPSQTSKNVELKEKEDISFFPDVSFAPMLLGQEHAELWTAADLTSVFEEEELGSNHRSSDLSSLVSQAPASTFPFTQTSSHYKTMELKSEDEEEDEDDLEFLLTMPLLGQDAQS